MDNIYKIDLVLVVVSLVVLIGVVGYVNPLVVSPLDDYETSETEILFSIENADVLLVDDNLDFTTPDRYQLKDGLKINLKPGKYYWKAVGVMESSPRTLTINSEVDLRLKFDGDGYSVLNAGNIRLNVDVYNGTELVDKVRVSVDEEADVSGDKFVGGSDE
jgi:hypothetical protein